MALMVAKHQEILKITHTLFMDPNNSLNVCYGVDGCKTSTNPLNYSYVADESLNPLNDRMVSMVTKHR